MLRSGERQIQSVTTPDFRAAGTWSCSACGHDFPAVTSRLVHFRHPDGRDFRFVVCGDCAVALEPHRIVIDLDRLEHETDLEWLRRRVEDIARRRSMEAERRLRLRVTDVHELAATVHTTPATLVRTLSERHVAERVA